MTPLEVLAAHRFVLEQDEAWAQATCSCCHWTIVEPVGFLDVNAASLRHAAHVLDALTKAGHESTPEALLETLPGLLLAHAAWQEGLSAGIAACNAEGPWRKPESPYYAPWAAAAAAETGGKA